MVIRSTRRDDFAAIAELTNAFIRSTAVHFGYEPVTEAEMAGLWKETQSKYPWLTVEVDGRFAGYAKAGPWRARAAYQWTAEAGIYVKDGHRGKGIGKALYGALIAQLRERGFHSMIGGMTLPNDASTRLHESLGFEFAGEFREAGFKLGEWHDVAFWQLMLTDSAHKPL